MNIQQNYFELLGLPEKFEIDVSELKHLYYQLQTHIHPDRYTAAAEKRIAMQYASQINEAYRILLDPLLRAEYLLSLQGKTIDAERNTAMPSAFLIAQMQWREAIEEAYEAADGAKLQTILLEVDEQLRIRFAQFAEVYQQDANQAILLVRELMFFSKLKENIKQHLSHLNDGFLENK